MTASRPVALVTGAARRIGAAIVRRLHGAGYATMLHCHGSQDEARALAAELDATAPGSAGWLAGDLADPAVPAALVNAALARFGRLDLLVNNASNFFPTPLDSATVAQWDALFAVNARAPFLLAQAAAPHLQRADGAIVNLVDIHAEQPLRDHPAYCAAKAALAALTRALALDLAPQVRVNAVAPGAILWPEHADDAQRRERLLAATPLRRTGTPEDIAEAVRWLAQDARYVTGQTMRVDGGRLMR